MIARGVCVHTHTHTFKDTAELVLNSVRHVKSLGSGELLIKSKFKLEMLHSRKMYIEFNAYKRKLTKRMLVTL